MVEHNPANDTEHPTGNQAAAASKKGAAALRAMLRPVAGWLWAGRLISALSAVCAITPYMALVQVGDVLLRAYNTGTAPPADRVWDIVLLLVFGFTGRLGLFALSLGITHWADIKLGNKMRGDIVTTLAHAPLSWFTESSSGRVRKAVQNDTHEVHYLIAHQPAERTSAIIMPIAALAYAIFLDWRLGLLAIGTLPIYMVVYSLTMRGMSSKTVEMDSRLGKVSATIVEFVAGIAVVKAFGRTGKAHARFADAAREFATFYASWCEPMLRSSAIALSFIAAPLVLLVNLAGGGAMVAAGWVQPAEVLATTLIAMMLPNAIEVMATATWSKQLASAAALRILDVNQTPRLPEPSGDSGIPESNTVELENVTFRYGETVALKGVSLTLPAGSITALVGPSGSGKTTLATLVARFADPESGSIRIGGVDLRDMSSDKLYRQVGFVLQDTQLLGLSLADNIRLARPDASLDQVRHAAQQAQIDEFISGLPDGYETVYGKDTHLSGGQQQRVAIARALLADAPILILDEATAFADPESEAAIQRALNTLVVGRTVLVIAHRIGSIIGADQIALLDRGRITAVGTHSELLDHPDYARMWTNVDAKEQESNAS